MEIFRELNKLGYKHYLDYTVEELDNLGIKSKEFTIEANLAFRWFREKHNLDLFIKDLYKNTNKVGYYFGIDKYKGVSYQMGLDEYYLTYEEAELECIKKLIKLCQK